MKDDRWKLHVQEKHHNHERSIRPHAHNVYRQRTPAERNIIMEMSTAGARPAQIHAAIQQRDPNTFVTARDVYSERKKIRRDLLNGRSSIETLLDNLSQSEWEHTLSRDSENHVQRLFLIHKNQLKLIKDFPDILMMDCTYRTNKHHMPLLHFIGCSNLHTWFSAAFCFLSQETEADYLFALSAFQEATGIRWPSVIITDQEMALKNAASSVFRRVPQLLCVWHINKNVQTKAQHVWRDANGKTQAEKDTIKARRQAFLSRWNELPYAKTEDDFHLKWQKLLQDYRDQPILCDYLTQNQFHTRKEWAAAWTSKCTHFGTITSSPAEGMHRLLKEYLQTSQGDLLRCLARMEQLIQSHYNKYQKDVSSALMRTKSSHLPEAMPYLPLGIQRVLTPVALELIRK